MKKKSKSGLFLMELIVIILFFSLASTVCIQLFVKSHLLGKETKELNHSVLQAQNIAESFLGSSGEVSHLLTCFPEAFVSNNSLGEFEIYLMYDKDFQITTDYTDCIYFSHVQIVESDHICSAFIDVCSLSSKLSIDSTLPELVNNNLDQDGPSFIKILYSLSVDKYEPERCTFNE